VPNNITTGVTLKVGAPTATASVNFGYSFYYDTQVTISTLVAATLTVSPTTTLYSTSFIPKTFNPL
jgi:hypothetical protein